MPAAPGPSLFHPHHHVRAEGGAHEGISRRLQPPLPLSARPIRTGREGTSPRPLPFRPRRPVRAERRHARARNSRPVPLLLWPRRPVHAERAHARARRPLPSPFARKGGARGHAAPLRPRSLPSLHDRVLCARKGVRVGAPPSALSFPIRAEGGRTRARRLATPLGRLPIRAERGRGKDQPPCTHLREWGDHAGTPPSRRLPPVFAQRGHPGAQVQRANGRGVEWKGGAHTRTVSGVGVAHKPSRGAPRDWEVCHPAQVSARGRHVDEAGGTRNGTRAPRLLGGFALDKKRGL
ncbi:hypothetical protein EDB85DRAFT_1425465 [Lactarius pseudohatsudake]|nr:hypothetical protein EDB85DRAFT_1425465 [Lactarius pseudohatsudake]